jgi:hypothetical protein
MNMDMLHRISETLLERRKADPETSYTAQLMAKGPDAILKKIGEETAELIMAGKGRQPPACGLGIRRRALSHDGAARLLWSVDRGRTAGDAAA